MIIINKKKLITILTIICVAVLGLSFKVENNNKTVETVALPVTNKVIVIDARASEFQMNGARN